MKNISSDRDKLIKEMLAKLRAMNKRGEKALKKADQLLAKQDKVLQKEMADYNRRYGK
jgi:Mg2+/Co2+ transporter CorB